MILENPEYGFQIKDLSLDEYYAQSLDLASPWKVVEMTSDGESKQVRIRHLPILPRGRILAAEAGLGNAPDSPLLSHPKSLITPHIGSRTFESVPRQAMRATQNLINFFNGDGEVFYATRD